MSKEVKWLRRLSEDELRTEKLSQKGRLLVASQVNFCARGPVQASQVQAALTHLFRKAPNLRAGVAVRDGELWFKEIEEEGIDFEVVSTDVEAVRRYLHTHTYNQDGPLWLARLIPVATPCYRPHKLASFHEDLQTTFPHCYYLMFGFSHTLGDGHTLNAICMAFAHILDHVVSGEAVDDTEQIGCFDLNELHIRHAEKWIAKLSEDDKWREECIRDVNEGKPEASLLSHILSYSEGPMKTGIFNKCLDKSTTTDLREKCRAMKITISSCLAAAGNLALVGMVAEKGVVQDTYSVSNSYLINMRRFWDKRPAENTLGCYGYPSMRQYIETPRSVQGKEFWGYARRLHDKFRGFLNQEEFMGKIYFNSWCFENGKQEHIHRDLTFNTLFDMTQGFEGTKEITVTNYMTTGSIHYNDYAWDIHFGTVRDQLTYVLKYNTRVISEATVKRFGDLVYARLVEVAGL